MAHTHTQMASELQLNAEEIEAWFGDTLEGVEEWGRKPPSPPTLGDFLYEPRREMRAREGRNRDWGVSMLPHELQRKIKALAGLKAAPVAINFEALVSDGLLLIDYGGELDGNYEPPEEEDELDTYTFRKGGKRGADRPRNHCAGVPSVNAHGCHNYYDHHHDIHNGGYGGGYGGYGGFGYGGFGYGGYGGFGYGGSYGSGRRATDVVERNRKLLDRPIYVGPDFAVYTSDISEAKSILLLPTNYYIGPDKRLHDRRYRDYDFRDYVNNYRDYDFKPELDGGGYAGEAEGWAWAKQQEEDERNREYYSAPPSAATIKLRYRYLEEAWDRLWGAPVEAPAREEQSQDWSESIPDPLARALALDLRTPGVGLPRNERERVDHMAAIGGCHHKDKCRDGWAWLTPDRRSGGRYGNRNAGDVGLRVCGPILQPCQPRGTHGYSTKERKGLVHDHIMLVNGLRHAKMRLRAEKKRERRYERERRRLLEQARRVERERRHLEEQLQRRREEQERLQERRRLEEQQIKSGWLDREEQRRLEGFTPVWRMLTRGWREGGGGW